MKPARSRAIPFFLAAAAAAFLAAPAHAGTLTAAPVPFAPYVDYTAGAGETNGVVMTQVDPGTLAASDSAGITAGSGCTQVDATHANCGLASPSPRNVIGITGSLGDGNDSFQYVENVLGYGLDVDGGSGDDTIAGGQRDDTLSGGPGADTLQGNLGDDTLAGGPGPDSYFGGGGNDSLLNSYANDDFVGGPGLDTVDYTGWDSNDPSCLPGESCPIGVDVTIDNVANDGDYDFDNDGVTYAAADNVRGDVEVVVGTSVADSLNGGTLDIDQTFTGAGGNDTIAGGPGTDLLRESADVNITLTNTALTGGLGTDTLAGIESADLQGGNGNNTLNASAFTAGPVTLRGGNEFCNLFGAGNGNDTLVGGDGNDTLLGGCGPTRPDNDTLTGGPGNDTINGGGQPGDVLVESGDVNMTLTNAALTGGLGTDTLAGLAAVRLTGGPGNNQLNASAFTAGPTTLSGGPGLDTLQGGSQADTLTGGPGNDTIGGGGSAGDRLLETADANMTLTDGALAGPATGTDSLANVELATLNGGPGANVLNTAGFTGAATLNGDDGGDTLTGGGATDSLNGDGGGDTLTGGAGADGLNGGGNDDVLDGGADNDVIHGDAGVNRVIGTGDTNWTLSDTSLTGNSNDTLLGIQRATLTGGPGDNALNASAFTLGPVVLNGGGGGDFLFGGTDGDTLVGGPGGDTFDAGAGDDDLRARDDAVDTSLVCGDGAADVANVDTGETADTSCESVLPPPSTQPPPTPPPDAGGGGEAGDTDPPETMISEGPKDNTKKKQATFEFTSSEPGSTFECAVDGQSLKLPCTSPYTVKVKNGKHTFQVHATDPAGNADATPASDAWKVKKKQ
jgi:Ca2+-binding RTX toxin-like protein